MTITRRTLSADTAQPRWRFPMAAALVTVLLGAGLVAANNVERTAPDARHPAAVTLITTDVPLPNSDAPFGPLPTNDDLGRFSYVAPVGWVRSGTRTLTYGTTLLANPALPDGIILLGPLDLKLFASSYPSQPDNSKASIRLASDMGTFLTPYTGIRLNWDTQTFNSAGLPAATTYFDTHYEDPRHEPGQLWTAVIGHDVNRFFALWRGTASSPVNRAAAQTLAESIRPY